MKKKYFNILFIFILIVVFVVNKLPAQKVYDYCFERDFSVTVLDSAANPYNFPWVGGMNSCQFSTIDLNFDGIEDLFVFDRSRNKILTFINNGTPNTIDYYYAPGYERLFQQYPPLTDWVMLKDFNCDGKKDLIAYSPGGIRIYENTSDTTLKFKLLTFSLNSFYYMGYSNLYLSYVDFPGIADMDYDTDMDITAFYILGVRIHYHKNLAMEKFGRCDTLDYKLNRECWGYFTEHENSNILLLNDSFCLSLSPLPKIPPLPVQEKIEKHSGSTMLLLDLNGDSLYDLLLGDADYSNLIKVINGGTPDSTHMVSQDINFPSNTRPVDVKYFPVPSYIDIDNDSIYELVVSPFDPQHYLSENDNCVWLYENNGVNNNPVFSFVKESFLQEEMIDLGGGAYPVIFDYNNDGLDDLVVSNFGRLDSSYKDPVWLTLHSFFRSSISVII